MEWVAGLEHQPGALVGPPGTEAAVERDWLAAGTSTESQREVPTTRSERHALHPTGGKVTALGPESYMGADVGEWMVELRARFLARGDEFVFVPHPAEPDRSVFLGVAEIGIHERVVEKEAFRDAGAGRGYGLDRVVWVCIRCDIVAHDTAAYPQRQSVTEIMLDPCSRVAERGGHLAEDLALAAARDKCVLAGPRHHLEAGAVGGNHRREGVSARVDLDR